MFLDNSNHKNNIKREQSLSQCLEKVKASWKGNVGGLIQDWAEIAGEQLAANCTPLGIQNKILTIGSSQPQWRQALIYNRLELIESLKSYGYEIKEIRIRQHYPVHLAQKESEKDIWENHPSRTNKSGTMNCPFCKVPSPKGEIKLWGKCSFCRRKELKID